MTRKMLAGLVGASLLLSAAGGHRPAAPEKKYAKPQTSLCRPDKAKDNYCNVDLSTTVVKADGSESVEAFKADPKAAIDCFYVYPTVSNDPGILSDMNAGPEEINVVKAQFARLGAKCRL